MKRVWLFLAALFLLWAGPAAADELRPGYLSVSQSSAEAWRLVWKAPIKAGVVTRAKPALPATCTLGTPTAQVIDRSNVTIFTARCPQGIFGKPIGLTGIDAAFIDALIRIAPLGRSVQTAVLTHAAPMITVRAVPDRFEVARTYVRLGIDHILFGFDHLLFVLALVLLIQGGWRIAQTVTAFTAAHSCTLIATSLNWISLERRPVEVCIALSIIFLAVEIVKARGDAPRLSECRVSERWPWLVAFVFGLLHGFGFAGALAEIGLPDGEVPTALLTFNMGVEIGQLLIVGFGLGVLWTLRRFAQRLARRGEIASAYAIGTVAAYWMFARAFV
jgi:hydrogenase/urease accessory protein HupE